MKKIILGLLSMVILGWSDTKMKDNLNEGFSIWKFEKNIKLCKSNGASKCNELGEMYASGKKVKQDQFKAKIFYFNACLDSFHGACQKLSIKYNKDTKQHYSNAEIFEKNTKLCEASSGAICYDLGRMYSAGNGVQQDQFHAKTFFKKSCDDTYAKGCRSLAMQYQRGRGGQKDRAKAKMLYKKACDGGDAMACALHKRIR